MFPTKILLAVDGSEESMRAARTVVALSKGLVSALHVVYVEPADLSVLPEREVYGAFTRVELLDTFERLAHKALDDLVAKVREVGGEVAQAHARVGKPAKEIVRLAEELGAGLVVVGSRGFGAVRRSLMGSVSTSIVRHAHCPVLVVRGGAGERDGRYLPRRILLAVDSSREAKAAASIAAEISAATDAGIHVLYVMESAQLNPYAPYPGPEAWEVSEDVLKERREKAQAFVRREADHMEAEGGKVEEARLASGVPAKEIVGAAEELGADLIVLGSRGLGAVKRALMGAVSDSVVWHAHCPVLVVRAED